jgi:hypothetical protein
MPYDGERDERCSVAIGCALEAVGIEFVNEKSTAFMSRGALK